MQVQESPFGYWLGPFSFRLPVTEGASKGDVVNKGREALEVRLGEKLSDFIEVGEVFGGEGREQADKVLEVVRGQSYIYTVGMGQPWLVGPLTVGLIVPSLLRAVLRDGRANAGAEAQGVPRHRIRRPGPGRAWSVARSEHVRGRPRRSRARRRGQET